MQEAERTCLSPPPPPGQSEGNASNQSNHSLVNVSHAINISVLFTCRSHVVILHEKTNFLDLESFEDMRKNGFTVDRLTPST